MDVVTSVIATMNEVITALREEVAALADNEKRGRRRISTYLALLGIVVVGSLTQVIFNYRQGEDVKTIVSYIEECQTPDSECSEENARRLGGAVRAVSAATFDSITCVLNTLPVDRTDENIKACRDKHLGSP
jgi:hypothetical protein